MTSRWEARTQARKDKTALSALNTNQRFILYLRAFHTTNQIHIALPKWISWLSFFDSTDVISSHLARYDTELENVLISKFGGVGDLICLGLPGEHFGAGRIEVAENEWMETASLLMDRAFFIVCIPSINPGTRWEVVQIVKDENLIQKTFFLMPSCSDALRTEWQALTESLSKDGFFFPNAPPRPGMIQMQKDGQVVFQKRFLAFQSVRGALYTIRGASHLFLEFLALALLVVLFGYFLLSMLDVI